MKNPIVALGITLAIVGVDCAAAGDFRVARKAPDAETKDRCRESLSREDLEKQFLAEFHVRKSKELLTARNIEAARKHAEEAARLDAFNLEAQTLLRFVDDRSARNPDRDSEISRCVVNPEDLEIRNHIGKADALFAAQKFGDALREYESAVIALEALPHFSEFKRYLPDIKEKIEAASAAALREEYVRQEVRMFVRDRLNIAYIYFSRRRFDKAANVCDEILAIDPRYRRARELREDMLKSKHKDEWYNVAAAKIAAWQNTTESRDEMIPQAQSFRYPSAEEWRKISRRATICYFVEETPSAEKHPSTSNAVRIVVK